MKEDENLEKVEPPDTMASYPEHLKFLGVPTATLDPSCPSLPMATPSPQCLRMSTATLCP